jgi:hypothetical protein
VGMRVPSNCSRKADLGGGPWPTARDLMLARAERRAADTGTGCDVGPLAAVLERRERSRCAHERRLFRSMGRLDPGRPRGWPTRVGAEVGTDVGAAACGGRDAVSGLTGGDGSRCEPSLLLFCSPELLLPAPGSRCAVRARLCDSRRGKDDGPHYGSGSTPPKLFLRTGPASAEDNFGRPPHGHFCRTTVLPDAMPIDRWLPSVGRNISAAGGDALPLVFSTQRACAE